MIRTKRLKVLFLGLGIFLVVGLSNTFASNYLGQYCVDIQVGNENFTGYRLAVSAITSGTYLLNGTGSNPSTSGVASVIGNASVVGGVAIITLKESHTDEYGMSISTAHLNLNASTLSGTFENIAQDYSSGFEPLSHVSGTATMYPCE